MHWLVLALVVFGVLAGLLIGYTAWYLRWESQQTSGMNYYGRPLAGRRRLKRDIRLLSGPARPLVSVVSWLNRQQSTMPAFEYKGVSGPPRVSSPEIFARAEAYTPGRHDVFVATQMRCGTTWMQQLVYEIAERGGGDLSDGGHGPLYRISPWIDGANSVAVDQAPMLGTPPMRIIKTHLPVTLCPYGPEAKYIYVTRHPVSCFASIVDYTTFLAGPLAPSVERLADWFCSDRMYWLPWPRHVEGWWEWAATRDNVLFVHFEDMKRNLDAIVDRVASFLGCTLDEHQRRLVLAKCSFDYMQSHEEQLEMAPPTMYSVARGKFLTSGAESRGTHLPDAVRAQIQQYCRDALSQSPYPVERFYPDLARRDGSSLVP